MEGQFDQTIYECLVPVNDLRHVRNPYLSRFVLKLTEKF